MDDTYASLYMRPLICKQSSSVTIILHIGAYGSLIPGLIA